MLFVAILKAFTLLIAFMTAIAWFVSLNVAGMVGLGMREGKVTLLEEKLAFSDARSGHGRDPRRRRYHHGGIPHIVPGGHRIAMAVAHEARTNQISPDRHFANRPKDQDACCFLVFSEGAQDLWEGVSGGLVDWVVDAGLRLVLRWLKVDKEFSMTDDQDPLGPQTAAEMAAGLVALSSRLYLRLNFAVHRVFGCLSVAHGWMGEFGLVPPEVDFRALIASRHGSYVPAVIDLTGAHTSFWWGDQISSAMSAMRPHKQDGDDDKCSKVR